mgnify:CR=1 FL=1
MNEINQRLYRGVSPRQREKLLQDWHYYRDRLNELEQNRQSRHASYLCKVTEDIRRRPGYLPDYEIGNLRNAIDDYYDCLGCYDTGVDRLERNIRNGHLSQWRINNLRNAIDQYDQQHAYGCYDGYGCAPYGCGYYNHNGYGCGNYGYNNHHYGCHNNYGCW